MSKRSLIIVVAVVIVLLLASPYAIGMWTESAFRGGIDEMDVNAQTAAQVTDFERGWMSSQATLEFGLSPDYVAALAMGDPMMMGMLSQTVPVIVEIGHGPILTLNGTEIGSAAIKAYVDPESPLAQTATQTLGMPYPIELRGRIGFGSGFSFEGEIPPFDGAIEGTTFSSSGLNFSGVSDGSSTIADIELESASLQAGIVSFILESLAVNGESERTEGEMPLGTFDGSIGRLVASNPFLAEPMLSLSGFGIAGSTLKNDTGNLDIHFEYRSDALSVPNGIAVTDAALGFSLNNLSADAMNRYQQMIDSGELVTSSFMNPEAMAVQLMPLLDQIVAAGPTLAIEPAQFSMGGGSFDASASATIDADAMPTGTIADLQDVAVVIAAISAELDATVSKSLIYAIAAQTMRGQLAGVPGPDGQPMTDEQILVFAEQQIAPQIAALTAQGLVTDDGQTLTTRIEFTNGVPTANGVPIPAIF